MIILKSSEEIAALARAGRIVAKVFAALESFIRPRISTLDIDTKANEIIEREGAVAAFYHYGKPPFPGHVCVSVDDEVVHGIPSAKRILREGSIVSVDVGSLIDGWYGDACRTYLVGEVDEQVRQLVQGTEEAFWQGFAQARVGKRLGDIQAAVQACAEAHHYGIVRELTGHGVGVHLHEDPAIPNYGRSGHGPRLEEGMVLALEPMLNLGTAHVRILDDDWTVVTADGKPSAHYENTFAITADGPVILTKL